MAVLLNLYCNERGWTYLPRSISTLINISVTETGNSTQKKWSSKCKISYPHWPFNFWVWSFHKWTSRGKKRKRMAAATLNNICFTFPYFFWGSLIKYYTFTSSLQFSMPFCINMLKCNWISVLITYASLHSNVIYSLFLVRLKSRNKTTIDT